MNEHKLYDHGIFHPKEFESLGHKLTISHAPEPNDIIWENLGANTCCRFFKALLIYSVAIVLVFAFLFAYYSLSRLNYNVSLKTFPMKEDCAKIDSQFGKLVKG